MSQLLNAIAIGGLVLLVISKTLAIAFYDSLLRHQFETHHESWEVEGSHRGMNWKPPSARPSFFGQSHAWNRWLFNTPTWARSDRRALRTLLHFRIAEGLAGAAIAAVVLALIAGRPG